MTDHVRTHVLLEKAYRVMRDIYEAQEQHTETGTSECPFCMGELIDRDDRGLMEFIKNHLEST